MKDFTQAREKYEPTIASRLRKLNALNEGMARMLSEKQQLDLQNKQTIEEERQASLHLLNDFESRINRKEFAVKTHQKFRKDMMEVLKRDQEYLPTSMIDATMEILENDPTPAHDERIQSHRYSVATRVLALQNNKKVKKHQKIISVWCLSFKIAVS